MNEKEKKNNKEGKESLVETISLKSNNKNVSNVDIGVKFFFNIAIKLVKISLSKSGS